MSLGYGPDASGKIHSFLRDAASEMERAFTPARFVHLRYDLLNCWYPHEPFGVDECSPDFFAQTLAYVTGERPIPELRPGTDARADQTYWRHYRDWCRLHARMHWQK